MKTRCYCVYCPHHPLFEKRAEIEFPVGWNPVDGVWWHPKYEQAGADVECLEPVSDAFSELNVDAEDLEFEKTAYDDGNAVTGYAESSYVLLAICGNEEYED